MKRSETIELTDQSQSLIPFSFQNRKLDPAVKGKILAADIGGTKANFAIFDFENNKLTPILEKTFVTKEYASFFELYRAFLPKDLPVVDSICLGVAGPVIQGRVTGTNFSWEIDEKQIQNQLGVERVKVLNDLEANAFGLAALKKNDFEEIKTGSVIPGNAAIISPGTGLGEAGLYWDGEAYHPFATEGGHCDFSPRSAFDLEFLKNLQMEYGHVSWERILSGAGIYNIYKFLVLHHKIEEPLWFKEQVERNDPAVVISTCAAEGKYAACSETMELFTRYLAIEAAQVALKYKATGGIFLGGGILPKILKSFDKQIFIENFICIERMGKLLENIQVQVILNQHAPKLGTAIYAAMQLNRQQRL